MTLDPNPMIQLPALPLAAVNLLLQGMQSLPIGQGVDLYLHLRRETQRQIDELRAAAEKAEADEKAAEERVAARADYAEKKA